jgi:pilus assembly protein CpaB
MNFRALAFAFVVAAVSGTLLLLYLRRLEIETSGGSPVRVLMVVKPIDSGAILTEEMIVVRAVPQAYVESRAIRETDRARVIGLKMETPVKAQQTLMWTDLALATDDRRYLSDLVQPGMRAVPIRAVGDDHSFSLVRPGDRVDVIANLPDPAVDHGRIAVLVAQNLLVLAVGLEMGGEGAAPNACDRRDVLTLSASVQQSQQLSLAQERGKVSVAVKPRTEATVLESVADMPVKQLYGSPDRPRVGVAAPPPSGPILLAPKRDL